jgi:hypothetical protein
MLHEVHICKVVYEGKKEYKVERKVWVIKIVNFLKIDLNYYETPSVSDPKLKNIYFLDRHIFNRYACHGFLFIICERIVYH